MRHLQERELVQHFYADDDHRATVERHLMECERCRAEFENLAATLKAMQAPAEPEPDETYGTRVWASIRPRLEPQRVPWWRVAARPRRFAIAGAMAALIIAAFLAGRVSVKPPTGSTTAVSAPSPSAEQLRERALRVALNDHLDRSQMLLLQLRHEDDSQQEQILAEELLSDNRLYRQSAEQAGQANVAQVLDQLERVLLDIAHAPSGPGSQLEEIRKQVEAQNLLFKIRVLRDNVRHAPRRESNTKTSPARSSNAS